MSEHVKISDANGVRTILIARPEKKNALTHAMYAAITDALASAETEPSVRVALITGEGDVFTAGNDLVDFMNQPPTTSREDAPPVAAFLETIATMETPLAAAVNGLAVGVGVTMLLHVDLVYAAEEATFRTPFVDLGLVPEAASSLLLPHRIGHARAAEMFLLGETMGAEDALGCGLVAKTFERDALMGETVRRCEALARKAPAAVRATKRLMRGDGDAVRARMAEELAVFAARLQSDEFREAAGAFLEKRAPDFSRFA